MDAVEQQADAADRDNAFGFLRWFFAALVVVSHAVPLGGFSAARDPIAWWSHYRISGGTFAVLGFFAISGYLVTLSWVRTRALGGFVLKRFLRIMPGYWVCLIAMVVVIGPLAWVEQHGHLAGYVGAHPGPAAFVANNVALFQRQTTVGDLFAHSPLAATEGSAGFNGSLWTLPYEVLCYAGLAGIALLGLRRWRVATVGVIVALAWAGTAIVALAPSSAFARALPTAAVWPFTAVFFTASLAALSPRIMSLFLRLGPWALIAAVMAMPTDGEWLITVAGLVPGVLWLGHVLPFSSFERIGDLSYGTYIYAFPIQMLLAAYGVPRFGFVAYVVVALGLTSLVAFCSWHLVEKRALRVRPVSIARRSLPDGPRDAGG